MSRKTDHSFLVERKENIMNRSPKTRFWPLAVILLTALSAPTVSPAGSRGYTFQTIDVPYGQPGVEVNTQVVWLNDSGILTVQYQMPLDPNNYFNNLHTAMMRHGTWTKLDVPGASTTGGTNANEHGEVALSYTFDGNVYHVGILGRHGLEQIPSPPKSPLGMLANGINNRGELALSVQIPVGTVHSLLGRPGHCNLLDYPGTEVIGTALIMLNDSGAAVGGYWLSDGSSHACKYERGEFATIDPPGASGAMTFAYGINNQGVIVGVYLDMGGNLLGFLLQRGNFRDFVVPGATWTNPTFINEAGEISGIYGDISGFSHGFVATPHQ